MLGGGLASRMALLYRKWRDRTGISAPRVTVTTHLPWHWRFAAVVVLSAISLALAGWIYDAGRRFAGFHQEARDQELSTLQEQVMRMSAELEGARKLANSSDSRLKIESTAQDRLIAQVRGLEEENARLKSELAMFENLVAGHNGPAAVEINRLQIVEDGGLGAYRYRLLISQKGAARDKEFRGGLQFVLSLQKGKDTVNIKIPSSQDANDGQYTVVFRHFGRVEGGFSIPQGTQLKRIEAQILDGGALRASRSLTY